MGGIRSKLLGVAVLGATLLGGTGCFSPPPDAVARLEQLKQQGAEMDAAADTLEERFLGNQAKVQLWQELQRRHKNVTQIALTNHNQHLEQMLKLYTAQQEKARRVRNSGSVASASGAYVSKRPALNAR